jgi:hypothetical protein
MANYHDIRYDMTLSSSTTGGGSMVLLETQTASSDATISFTSNIDSTYKEYIFKYINVHPANNGAVLRIGFRDGSTAYDATKTSTYFDAEHAEDGTGTGVAYNTSGDLAQGTGFQDLTQDSGNDNDQSISGSLHLFNPSSTTFVKHYIARTNSYTSDDKNMNAFIGGYCNVTVAIDAVQFKFSGGNIDAGTFKMYGVN